MLYTEERPGCSGKVLPSGSIRFSYTNQGQWFSLPLLPDGHIRSLRETAATVLYPEILLQIL